MPPDIVHGGIGQRGSHRPLVIAALFQKQNVLAVSGQFPGYGGPSRAGADNDRICIYRIGHAALSFFRIWRTSRLPNAMMVITVGRSSASGKMLASHT